MNSSMQNNTMKTLLVAALAVNGMAICTSSQLNKITESEAQKILSLLGVDATSEKLSNTNITASEVLDILKETINKKTIRIDGNHIPTKMLS